MNRLLSCALLVVALAPTAATAQGRRPGTSAPTLPPSPTVIGTPPSGQNAMEFIGSGRDNGSGIMPFGYFTHIDGLPDDLLFSDPSTRTEATARFTFVGATGPGSREALGSVINATGSGSFTIFFNANAGASLADPSSFGKGQSVAVLAARAHAILHVLAPITPSGPGKALFSATADVIQTRADPFTLQGKPFVLGKVGQRLRLSAQGDLTLFQLNPPRATSVVAGEVTTVAP